MEPNTVVQLDPVQFETIQHSLTLQSLLTNRVEWLLLLNVVMLVLFIYHLMRSK